jgi:phytoene desaturase
MLLAKAGLEVTVVEKRGTVGGRTSTLEQDGFRFDVGPTFFLFPQVLREIFAATDHSLEKEVPMYRLDPQYRLMFGSKDGRGGGQVDATPDVERMKTQIAAICPADAARLENYFRDNRKKLQRFTPILQTAFESWRDLLRPEILRMLPLVRPWRSLDSDLRKYFEDERIRLGFSFQSKYLGMSPFSCPSLFSILSFLEYEHGVFHPVGGCGAVTQAMARIAEGLGVKIMLDTPVEEMLFTARRVTGVRTADETIEADAVVVNADFAQAMQRMVPNHLRKRWTNERIAKKQFSCSTFMMYLGIEGRYDNVKHHTIYLSRNYEQNLRDIEHGHTLTTEDPSFYVQNACVTDATLAPKGMSTLYVLLPVTHEHANVNWERQEASFRAMALRQLEKIGITDVERRIRVERRLTPATWNSEFHLHLGATFSMAHSLKQMLHLRPHNRFEDMDGVYLVGGGTHPGSGLPVIFESARITSRLLLEDMELEPKWNRMPRLEGSAAYEAVR